jgi:release factor glutamine methyltransferase
MVINDLIRESKIDRLETILILCKLLDVDKSYIYTYGDKEVGDFIGAKFLELMEKRHSGYPIQYILGEREFMGLDFYLEEGVLVPRPDTEVLVEYIIEYIKKNYKEDNINVLDIGIGSGAIALSMAYYLKNIQVVGIDISHTAIKVANINKEKFKLSNVNFYKGDLFKALEGLNMEGKFDIIVSNPPYIKRLDIESLDIQVKDYEPRLALDGGIDGLDFYRRITKRSLEYLKDNSLLIYEIGYEQGKEVEDILKVCGFKDISILKDLGGHDRVVLGIKR